MGKDLDQIKNGGPAKNLSMTPGLRRKLWTLQFAPHFETRKHGYKLLSLVMGRGAEVSLWRM